MPSLNTAYLLTRPELGGFRLQASHSSNPADEFDAPLSSQCQRCPGEKRVIPTFCLFISNTLVRSFAPGHKTASYRLPGDPEPLGWLRVSGCQPGSRIYSPFCSLGTSHRHVGSKGAVLGHGVGLGCEDSHLGRRGVLFDPRGPFLLHKWKGKAGWQVPCPGRHHPHREPGCQWGGRSGCKQSELSWLAQGRSRDKTILCQGLCFSQHHLAGTQMERISLAGRRASQIQYLSTLPHPAPGLS